MARDKGRRRGSAAKGVAGVLDIGSSKVVCLIAALDEDGPRIFGIGHHRAEGVKGGVVIDLDRVEQAARAAIAEAERMAGVELAEVHVSVACGRLQSHNFSARADVASGVVSEGDINRVLAAGQAFVERQRGRGLVHINEVAMRLDGTPGLRDPRGMAAREIALDLHAVSADDAPLRNLLMAVNRCYLNAASHVPAPLASALAAASEDERRLGVTVVDIGAGTTDIAMFAENRFVYAHAAPLGGTQMTFDIARALHTPLAEAERIKALYGTVVCAPSDEHDAFTYSSADDDGIVHHMTKAELAEVIRPRVTALGHHIRQRLEECGMTAYAGRSIVLTGGVSQLTGLADFFAAELGRPVRVAGPQAVPELPLALSSAAFSTAVGLLVAEAQGGAGRRISHKGDAAPGSYLKRVGSWLREGF